MLTLERQQEIMDLLSEKKSITVIQLARTLYVSEATIRRDLTEMEKQGLLKRSHGGAVLLESIHDETSSLIREQEHIREKRQIAQLAIDFVAENATIFMDSSSTAGMLIGRLKSYRHLTVITNGLKNAMLLSQQTSVHTYLTGGRISAQSNSAVGSDCIAYLRDMNAQVVFFSCSGVSAKNGITDANFEQAQLKKTMLANAKVRVLLCDFSKFDSVYMCRTCGFEQIDYLITDKKPSESILTAAKEGNCEILFPED